jgi:dienelactone hydrolase
MKLLKSFPRIRRFLLWSLCLLLAAAFALFLGVVTGTLGVHLPTPAGPYPVGRKNYDLVDPARKEAFTEADAPREIAVTVYYPAAPRSDAKPAPYVRGPMAQFLAARVHLPAAAATLIHCHSFENASAAEGRFPVVLFFPGMGTAPIEYTTLLEDLASRGYFVISAYPTYSVAVTVFGNGRVAPISEAGFRCENEPPDASEEQIESDRDAIGAVWVADARFILDWLAKKGGDHLMLRDHVQLKNVGICGHSFGGATAAEVVRIDKRFQAGVNLDGTPFRTTSKSPIVRSFLWMTSDYSEISDKQLARIQMSRKEFDTKFHARERQREPFVRLMQRGCRMRLRGSTHSTFMTDDALVASIVPGMSDPLAVVDGRIAARMICEYVAAFFDSNLKACDQTSPTLRETANPELVTIDFRDQL